MNIKVGVIGVGYLGRHHARIYSEAAGVELVAVADIKVEAAEEIAEKFHCRHYGDYREMLDEVQAVSIVTPTSSHFNIAMDCIASGKDLLIEKPITTTIDEADVLIHEAKKKGVLMQVGHLERYNPAVVALSEIVSSPRFIESERVSPFLGRATDVDVTLDLMIHDIDIVTSLLGGPRIRDFKVVGAKVLTEKVDVAKVWVEFEGGVSALITASRLSAAKRRLLKVYQDDGFLMLDYQEMKITRHYKKDGGIFSETLEIQYEEPLKEEIIDFIQCVRDRSKPRVSGEEGREALRVVLGLTRKIYEMG